MSADELEAVEQFLESQFETILVKNLDPEENANQTLAHIVACLVAKKILPNLRADLVTGEIRFTVPSA